MLAQYWSLVRGNRNFRLLWTAQIISELGDWFYALSVYDLLLQLTGHKAQAVGLALVFQVLPQTLAAPTAGVLNDRLRRKSVMVAADIARCVLVLGMLLVRTRSMVWLVYPLLLLETVAAAFFEPARQAIVPNIVSKEETLAANTLSAVTWSFCLAVGAALGGVAAVLLGRDTVFALNAVSFLASAWLIRKMIFSEPHTAGQRPIAARDFADFTPVREGVQYIRRDRRLLSTVFVKLGNGIVGANNVILPVLGERVFPVALGGAALGAMASGRGAMMGMSLLMAARGVGSLLGPVAAGMWAGDREARLRTGILGGFVAAGAGYIWLGTAGGLGVALLAVILAHAGSSTNWVFSTTLVQRYADDRFRGRVFAADIGINTLAISASGYLFGLAMDAGLPPRSAAILLGAIMFVPAAVWALVLRKRTDPRGPAD